RRLTIGEHGRLTPDEARSQAKKLLGAVESGADPIAAGHAAGAVRTFRDVAEEFMRVHVATKRKGRTQGDYAPEALCASRNRQHAGHRGAAGRISSHAREDERHALRCQPGPRPYLKHL